MGRRKKPSLVKPALLKLDLGCGQNKREGFTGVDVAALPTVDVVHDLFTFPWPFEDESVEEIHCSHFFEHVPAKLRGRFMDEVYRILIPEGKATFIVPHGRSNRAVQDFTHEWPPLVEESFLYFNKGWRDANKLDHYPVTCDFDFSYGYTLNPNWGGKAEEARNYGIAHYWNVLADIVITFTRRPAGAAAPVEPAPAPALNRAERRRQARARR